MQYCTNCGAEVRDQFCQSCGQSSAPPAPVQAMTPAPAQAVAYAHTSPAATLDPLEAQLLLSRAKPKSPGFAACLGFFFPWAAAFYNGKPIQGIIFLMIDVFFFLLSIIGIGIVLLLFYGFFGAYINYQWATQANQKALEQLLQQRRMAAGA